MSTNNAAQSNWGGVSNAQDVISIDGKIRLHVDGEEWDFHITARPAFNPQMLAAMVAVAASWGLEPLDDGEYESEFLDDGSIRIHLVADETYFAYADNHPLFYEEAA
ncbi:hypothetical protein AB0G73_10560 [Streptomyces sp. NPDC020719]|uniref:hypothetical protein n=1 Tax=Streptomyces sp. NPDC020719 TaxID=3154896 RepID=UPI003411EC83